MAHWGMRRRRYIIGLRSSPSRTFLFFLPAAELKDLRRGKNMFSAQIYTFVDLLSEDNIIAVKE